MATATLAPSLVRLFAEIDKRWPNRDHWSDGWIGDDSHATRFSDHNPDANGVVHAIDVDATLDHAMGPGVVGDTLLASLLKDCRSGRLANVVHYVIHRGHIYVSERGYAQEPYDGTNQHESHVHVSIHRTNYARGWNGTWMVSKPVIWADKTARAFEHPMQFIAPKSVARVQKRLVASGFLKAPYIIGRPGKKTRAAMKAWQKARTVKVTGIPTRSQLVRLAGDVYDVK